MTDKSSWRLGDDVTGDVLPESVRQALRDVPLAAVRRVLRQRPRLDCPHPADERMQLYSDRDYCRVCGQVVGR